MGMHNLFLLATPDGAAGAGSESMIIWLVVMAGIFYFILWRPQKKREKQERELRSSIQPGDHIVTIGGFVGRVLSVKDDEVVFETGADRTKLTIKKHAIQQRTSPEQMAKAAEQAAQAEAGVKDEKGGKGFLGLKKKDEAENSETDADK